MRFLYYLPQAKQLILLVYIIITPIICFPNTKHLPNIACDVLKQNYVFSRSNALSKSIPSTSPIQNAPIQETIRKTRPFFSLRSSSTSPQRLTTSKSDFDSFSNNLKRAALILAGIAIGLGILRICLMLCKTRSSNNTSSNRHSAMVRPEVATVEHHQFKPELPPAYAEAIRSQENDGGKLPSYEELPHEQLQSPPNNYNDPFISTQV